MKYLQNISSRHKQVLIIMLTSSVALLLACSAFVAYDATMFRSEMVEKVSTLAEVVGVNTSVAIDFDDPASAEKTLSTLRAEPNIVRADVRKLESTVNDKPFATYAGIGSRAVSEVPRTVRVHHEFKDGFLHLFRPITQGEEQVGTIELVANLHELRERLWHYAGIVVAVFIASLLVTFLLSVRLERVVYGPILHLAQVVKTVATEKNYSVRATKTNSDELGLLIDGFNEMLARIQERDAALESARDNLEQRVGERTHELATSVSLLEATLESTTDGILALDTSGRITSYNSKFAAIWQFSREQLKRRDAAELAAYAARLVKDGEGFLQMLNRSTTSPAAESFDVIELKDGRVFERYSLAQRIEDKCVGVVVNWRDITERKRAEEAISESRALYLSLVEQLSSGMFRKDKEGRYVFANSSFCHLKGLNVGDFLGKTPDELAAFEMSSQCVERPEQAWADRLARQGVNHHEQILKTGQSIELEEEYPGPDGKPLYFHVVKSPVCDSEGKVIGSQGILFDITERKLAEEAVHESRSLYHSLVEQLPINIYRKDAEGRYVFANSRYCKAKGITKEFILGKTVFDITGKEAAEKNVKEHEYIMRTGESVELEESYTRQDGTLQHCQVVKLPVYGSDGCIVGSQGVHFDITDRKQAEAELAYERDLLKTLMDNFPDLIYFKDMQSRFVRVSRSILGKTHATCLEKYRAANPGAVELPEELSSLEKFEAYFRLKSDFDFLPKDFATALYEEEQNIIQTGQPVIGKLDEGTLMDGSKAWYLSSKLPWKDKNGRTIGIFGTTKDVTAIKQAEAGQAHERHLLLSLMDSSPDAIYFKDRESRFLRCSAVMARILGVASVDEIIGKRDADFFASEHADTTLDEEQAIIQTGKPILGKIEKEAWPDGHVTWALTSKMPLRDVNGTIVGTFGISKDITRMKEAEVKLEEVHRKLMDTSRQAGMAEVATSVLHNVGNVLNSVNTSVGVIADKLRSSKINGVSRLAELLDQNRADLAGFLARPGTADHIIKYQKTLAQHLVADQGVVFGELSELTKNIEHIKEIVAMQQSYARVSGLVELQSLPVLIEDALRMHAGGLMRHGVRIVRKFEDVPDVPVDKHKFLQVVVNLISNSKYALSDSGKPDMEITLGLTTKGTEHVLVSVSDNGVGIAPENLTRIFSHGFTTRKTGHGFGLHSGAIAAREMGGTLRVHSDGSGRGAIFTLELPVEPKEVLA